MTAIPKARPVPYQALRARKAILGYRNEDITNAIGTCSRAHIDQILAAKTVPRLSECYRIMDILGIPRGEFTRYWPADPYEPSDVYADPNTPRRASGRK